MMDITTSINQAATSQGLLDIVNPANELKVIAKVSFWGSKSIQVIGFSGESEIDILASKIMNLTKAKGFEYHDQERKAGERIAKIITRIYESSDDALAKCNFITRFFASCRESFSCIKINGWMAFHPYALYSKTRWNWLECFPYAQEYRHIFKFYTLKQYEETFGEKPDYITIKAPSYFKLQSNDNLPGLYLGRS